MSDHPRGIEALPSLPQTAKRLQRAHDLWHQALASYNDVERFTMNLNAAIQELRNATWILQKERPPVPDFDAWYAEWQQRLKASPAARWIVDARNRITKRGDLESQSTAKLSLVSHYGAPESLLIDVPPTMTNEALARAYLLGRLSRKAKKHGTLIVERKWEVAEFPGREILSILAEAFSLVEALANDAQRRVTNPGEPQPQVSDVSATVPSCMQITRDQRRLHVKLSTLQRARFVQIRQQAALTEEEKKTVEERYGSPPDVKKDEAGVPDLFSHALVSHNLVRKILETDGYSLTYVDISLPGGEGEVHVLMPEDKAEVIVMMQKLAEDVEQLGACAVVVSGEIWIAPAGTAPLGEAALSPGRREAIMTSAEDDAGQCVTIMTRFDRLGSAIIFEATEWDYSPSPSLSPVRALWRRKRGG